MLKNGDRVMVLGHGALGEIVSFRCKGIANVLLDETYQVHRFFEDTLAQLPHPKEPCPMCGSTQRYHLSTTCEV